jgi:antitoxin MazE
LRQGDTEWSIVKWGDSLAVRLPTAVIEALDLKEGDEIELHATGMREATIVRTPGRDELIERLRKFRGRLPDDFKFDHDETNDR